MSSMNILDFSGPSSSRSSTSPPRSLRKGKACLNCRRRKIKCDGDRPSCGQCIAQARTPAESDCEYAGAGPSRTQILQENIAKLEARIQELEDPATQSANDTIQLFHPYPGPSSRAEFNPFVDLSTKTMKHDHSMLGVPEESPTSSGPSTPLSVSVESSMYAEEPPSRLIPTLLSYFLNHSSQFGFFLHLPRIHQGALMALPLGHYSRPTPALLSSIYLWGVCLSGSPQLRAHEGVYLSRALRHTATTLSTNHPDKILHAIQAEVLLAYYFFRNGRVLEGKYHTSAAVSLVFSARLHVDESQGMSTSSSFGTYTAFGDENNYVPPSIDAISQGERVNAFWAVLILNNCWSAALKSPSNVDYYCRSLRIKAPWPLDMQGYELLQQPMHLPSMFTVERFFNHDPDETVSAIAMYAKSSILYERASHISEQYSADNNEDPAELQSTFMSLSRLIAQFQSNLPSVTSISEVPASVIRTVVVAHTLVHASIILLHRPFVSSSPNSRDKALLAAQDVFETVQHVNIADFGHIDPIMGVIWGMTSHFLLDEVVAVKNIRLSWSALSTPSAEELHLVEQLERAMGIMALFQSCPVIYRQWISVKDAYNTR